MGVRGIVDGDFNLVMGRALCFNVVEDGPSFLFEPTAPVLVNDQACSLETELYLSGPEAMTSSGHPSSGLQGQSATVMARQEIPWPTLTPNVMTSFLA
jgi:hypothetical protein